MNEQQGHIVEELRALRTVATPDLRPAVLTAVGVADQYSLIDTPLGPMYVAWNDRGVSAVERAEDADDFERSFRARFGRRVYPTDTVPASLNRAIVRHLETGRSKLDFDLRTLSEFERAVLRKALEIPRGEIRPYAWIAREIGSPRAVRAVGSALARNPIPLLIPCHRVVRSDGVIGNYGLGGPQAKRTILAAEGVDPAQIETLSRQGGRYVGSDTTRIFCFPTCRNARRVTPAHRRVFQSEVEAAGAGYRPCRVCRPA